MLKLELFIVITVSLTLIGSATLNGIPAFAQNNITNSSNIVANANTGSTTGVTYGGVDIDSKIGMINCEGEINGSVKTDGIQADAFVRHGTITGVWRIVNENSTGQDKGGAFREGWTDGKKYGINGVEQYDGICKAKLPKDIRISGDCGTGVEIKYATVDGNNDTFTGNARCYISTAKSTSEAGNMTGIENETGNTTEPLNLTAKMQELQK